MRRLLLWCRAVRSMMKKLIKDRYMQEKKRVPPESEKELRFHMENVTRLTVRDLQQWLSGKVWILIP